MKCVLWSQCFRDSAYSVYANNYAAGSLLKRQSDISNVILSSVIFLSPYIPGMVMALWVLEERRFQRISANSQVHLKSSARRKIPSTARKPNWMSKTVMKSAVSSSRILRTRESQSKLWTMSWLRQRQTRRERRRRPREPERRQGILKRLARMQCHHSAQRRMTARTVETTLTGLRPAGLLSGLLTRSKDGLKHTSLLSYCGEQIVQLEQLPVLGRA